MSEWICVKCENAEFEKDQFQATGGNFAKIFDVQNKKFVTVSCTKCGYTEIYKTRTDAGITIDKEDGNEFDPSKYTLYLKNINDIDTKSYIGKTITAKIDRQMGSKHPKYGFVYPINYGYIPNTISGDGEEIDCYILGVFEPIESFTGKCIAIIHRLNDNDDKLVLVPKDKKYTNDEIRALIEFQERFFESIIIN